MTYRDKKIELWKHARLLTKAEYLMYKQAKRLNNAKMILRIYSELSQIVTSRALIQTYITEES